MPRGSRVERKFVALRNAGPGEVRITGIELPIDGLKLSAPRVVPPGGEAEFSLELETAPLVGDVAAEIVVLTDDPAAQRLTFELVGRVESAIEIAPRPAIFLSVFRWQLEEKEGGVVLSRNDGQPWTTLEVSTDSDELSPVVTMQPDGRPRVAVRMRPGAAAGKRLSRLFVRTERETIELPVYTFVKERVYFNPEEIEFGLIDRAELARDPELRQYFTRSFFLYRVGGEPFEIRLEVPDRLTVERQPEEGAGSVVEIPRQGATAVFELTVSLNLELVSAGPLRETLRITTNDPEFPTIAVPVRAEIE
ncbi:MAG: hypothetical protein NDJ75_01805 [Thermoanaerobaculia bacterium]|nr:hypothetical protein [Thermoanaerobaculia bacterium]